MEKMVEIEIDLIEVSPFQPRKHFSDEELQELAQSIQSIGLLQPPVVRQIPNSESSKLRYELIAGERRLRASILAGLKIIPVIVKSPTDEQAAEASLIENVQRVDLNPLEIASAFQQLINMFQLTQEEVAEKVGKKRSTVANYLRLLTLPGSLKEALNTGSISMGHAKALLSLEDSSMQECILKDVLRDQLTVRETEKAVNLILSSAKPSSKPSKRSLDEAHLNIYEKRLEEKFGTKVKIDLLKLGGTISFNFYSLDDFERILSLMDASIFVD